MDEDLNSNYIQSATQERIMKLADRIKSITYFKSHASDVLDDLSEPWIITRNGEARAVVQDIEEYERLQETLAMLKILALGQEERASGKVTPAPDVLERLRTRNEDE
jgi:prevent-host-death family protein